MRHNAQELDKAFTAPRDTISFWLFLAGLFFFVFLLWGKPVPYSNEFPYLLRLVKEAQPEFLLNDWTFSVPANEHWLFNRLFGFLATLLSIEILGWLGRIALWTFTLILLLRIGPLLWKIPVWAATVAIAFWLAIGQSLVADEWIVGGFEAKGISYVFLLSALYYFSLRRTILPAVLLGLAFAFHPAIGLWGALAVWFALLAEKTEIKTLAKIVGLTSVIALIGIAPLVVEQFGRQTDSAESWRYIVLVRFPWHFDPFYFSRGATVLLLAMLAFNFAVLRRNDSFAMRFLLKFQIGLAIFFLAAFVLRWFEMFEWLRFLPVRLFPVFTPLFFAFTVFRAWTQAKSKRSKILIALFVFAVIFRLNPFAASFTAIQNTYVSWTAAPDDFQKTSTWTAANTPNGAIVIQPPHRRDVWYLSRRATVAIYAYQTFGRLDEWRERVADLTGNAVITDSQTGFQTVEDAYNRLSANQINEIRKKYAATYLVSRAEYPFLVVFQTETYKIYRLPND